MASLENVTKSLQITTIMNSSYKPEMKVINFVVNMKPNGHSYDNVLMVTRKERIPHKAMSVWMSRMSRILYLLDYALPFNAELFIIVCASVSAALWLISVLILIGLIYYIIRNRKCKLSSYIHNAQTHSLILYSLELSLSVDYYAPVRLTLSCMVQGPGFIDTFIVWSAKASPLLIFQAAVHRLPHRP